MSDVAQQPATRCQFCGGPISAGCCLECGKPIVTGIDETFKMPRFVALVPTPAIIPPSPDDESATLPRVAAIDAAASAAESDRRETSELIDKSIRGTQWIMIAILIGVPLGLLTQIIMGRISQSGDALGTYRLMIILVNTVQTFFLFGGSNVIVNFIPRATATQKSALLLSYMSIAAVFCVVFFTAMLLFPRALSFILLNRPVNSTIYLFLLVFIPVVIFQTLTIAVLQGEMELPAAARTQYAVQTMSFALTLVVVLVVVPRHLLSAQGAVALVVPGAYLISFLSGLVALLRVMRKRWQFSLRWYLPSNFWNFTTTFHFNTIVWFFFNSIDQLFILYAFTAKDSIGQVGIYGAALVVTSYMLWAPNLFTGAMYPFFTNLVAKKDYTTLKAAYQRYSAITAVVVAFVSLAAGLFAPQIIHLFGKGYARDATPLMIVFSLMYVALSSLAYVPGTALITAHEDIWLNLILNILALTVRFGLYFPFFFIYHFGLMGIAVANAISLSVLYLGTLAAIWLRYRVTVPLRQHGISISGGLLLVGVNLWQPASHTLQLAERGGALLLFVLIISRLRLISRDDFARVAHRFGFLSKIMKRMQPRAA